MSALETIAVIGGGLMGGGIAQVFAHAGHDVRIFEPDAQARKSLDRRLSDELTIAERSRVLITDDMAVAVSLAGFVTEAAPEKLDLKRSIFAQLVEHADPGAILASNTSVIPIGRIVSGLPTAERMIGTHWWNPAPLIPLVEVVQAETTSSATVAATMELLLKVGKAPAHIRKDTPGFVANRLQHALWREAIAMVAEGVCDAGTVDLCVKQSFGRRLAVLGPLENADMVGLDLTLDIHRTIIPELDRHAGPHELLESKVAAGELGFKSGSGFCEWTEASIAACRDRLNAHLKGQLA